ncbi:hypothetical protein TNCV_5102681 [Trichonephila clavipes]|nr:hypothetical protein TNCV_5102681 [Trichonephila clavipes]
MPSLPVLTDAIRRLFKESSVLEQVVTIHSGMAAEWAGLVSSHAKPLEIEAHEIHRDMGQNVRLSLALALSTIQVTVRLRSVKFQKGRNECVARACMELEGSILLSHAPVLAAATTQKTFEPTDLTSTYSVCPRMVFGGIGHRTQAFRSRVRCSTH